MENIAACPLSTLVRFARGEAHPEVKERNMFCQIIPRAGVLALSVLLLSACANNETKPADDANSATPTTSASATVNGSKQAPAASAQEPVEEIPNPAIITFDKLSVKLDEAGKQSVARMAEKAEASKKLEVWGFCDRKQIGNPVPCATQRAVAVQKELQANGVKTPKVRIRYNTEKANAHAVEVWFN
jgi:outer membrane protein OmpA-like peptidoglycan-associated protein